jgi:hypothetical protein
MKIFARMLRHPGILAVVLLTVALPVLTQAHAKLEKTVPADKAALTAPPTSVQLWFSEKPDAAVSKIELKGPSGVVKLGPLMSWERRRSWPTSWARSETAPTRSTGRRRATMDTYRRVCSRSR